MNPVDLARRDIQALAPYASARALAGSDGILLNANENPWAPPHDGGLSLNRYPDPQPAKLRERLAEHYGAHPDNILITRGSDEGIDLLVRAFCRSGVDRVLICPPCFGMYALSAKVQGAEIVEVPLLDMGDTFAVNLQGIAAAAPSRIYFLCSPNNPTGHTTPKADILRLASQVANHGLVVLDEAYIEFQQQPSLAACLEAAPNLVVLRTLSKAFALAGCRVGALIANPGVVELLRRIIAPYPLPTPSVHAALQALTPQALARQAQQLATLREQKTLLVKALQHHPHVLNIWESAANFVLIRATDGAKLVQDASALGIRLRDQSSQPGLRNAVRITVGTPDENRALLKFLEGWQP